MRRCVLATTVLDDVDVDLAALDRGHPVSWQEVATAVSGWTGDPAHPVARARVAAVITAAHRPDLLRAHAECVGSPFHPGPAWVRAGVPGGVLDIGWGVAVPVAGRAVVPLTGVLPPRPAAAAQWLQAVHRIHRLGVALADRLDRDHAEGRAVVLRPMAGCDVVTLLAAPAVRAWLARRDGTGLAAVAVPTRDRGWVDVRRVDPAFVRIAHAATPVAGRGLAAPVLVSRDEVGTASAGRPVGAGHRFVGDVLA